MVYTQLSILSLLCTLFMPVTATPDSGYVPLPGPGLSYGGIPYGSVSGNVAEFFSHHTPSSGRSLNHLANQYSNNIDFTPIEHYL